MERPSFGIKAALFMLQCFDSTREYEAWLSMMRSSGGYAYGSKTHGPCWDCTPEYKDAMVKAKRCEHPETVFKLTREGEMVGMWKKRQWPAEAVA